MGMIAHCHRSAIPFSSHHGNVQKITHRHSTGKRQTTKRFKLSDECQIRELAEAYNQRIRPTTNLNPSCSEEDFFPYVVSVQSFVVGGRSFSSTVTVCYLSPMFFLLRIVFSLINTSIYLSPYFIEHIFYGINQFPLQSKAVECCVFDPILTSPNRKYYDSYYPSNHILRANIQENMTHNVLPPMGVNVVGGK